ncbi:MAG: hypothetical protein IT431_06155 [Phycisphaerales bacterium]|nr:hypothetical protein [Phycisphaerales bacterium]
MTGPRRAEPIYVGYLPTPERHQRLLRVIVPAMLVLAVVSAGLIAGAQRSPGPASWSAEAERFEGTLVLVPYPVLLPDRESDPPMYLVAAGKFGAAGLGPLGGRRVEVRGTVLRRDNALMLELPSGAGPREVPGPTRALQDAVAIPVTLRGEIVDSKCCLGAMKPGEGKTHRACATLCVRGGIPPVLVSTADDGRTLYTLLTTAENGPANTLVLPHIAEPVTLRGALTDRAGIRVLAIDSIE